MSVCERRAENAVLAEELDVQRSLEHEGGDPGAWIVEDRAAPGRRSSRTDGGKANKHVEEPVTRSDFISASLDRRWRLSGTLVWAVCFSAEHFDSSVYSLSTFRDADRKDHVGDTLANTMSEVALSGDNVSDIMSTVR